MPTHHAIEDNLRGDEYDSRQRPCPQRNNLDFCCQSSWSFGFYLHKFASFLIAIAAILLRDLSSERPPNERHGPATKR